LVVVLDGVALTDWFGRLVGLGLKVSVAVVVGFDRFSAVGLLLDRVVRRRVGWRWHTVGLSRHCGRECARAKLDRELAPLVDSLGDGDGMAGTATSR